MSTFKSKHAIFAIVLLLGMIGVYCAQKNGAAGDRLSIATPPQVGDGWRTAGLKEAGMDSVRLLNLLRRIGEKEYPGVDGILIVKDGKLVLEEYFQGYDFEYTAKDFRGKLTDYDRSTIHNLASVTKSVTALLCGIAVDNGFIRSVDDKLITFFPEDTALFSGGKKEISLEHLLTMSSGLEWNEQNVSYGNAKNDIVQLFFVRDPLNYILAKPLAAAPGTKWYYNGGGTNLVGQIVQRTSGTRLDYFADEYLFDLLDIKDSKWVYINRNFVYASGDLRLRPRDMAKLGSLVLNKGVWNGKRVISAEWIEQMTMKHVALPDNEGYGYQWWLQPYRLGSKTLNSYQAAGWGGQQIIVLPELNAVVVITGSNYTGKVFGNEMMYNYIIPSMREDFVYDFDTIRKEAPLPNGLMIVEPDHRIRADIAAFSGHWCGQWDSHFLSCQLVVERIYGDEITLAYSWADHPAGYFRKGWVRRTVKLDTTGTIRFVTSDSLSFRIDPTEDVVIGNLKNKFVTSKTILRRIE